MSTSRPGSLPLKKLIAISLLVALSIIAKRFLGYNDRVISVSFGFVPIATAGMLFGPVGGLTAGALADLIGALLFPTGPFNPGFTLAAALSGTVYGLFLHPRQVSRQRIVLCQAIITLLMHLTINTLLLVPIVGKGFFAILPLRVVKNMLFFPVEVFTLIKMSEYRSTFDRLAK